MLKKRFLNFCKWTTLHGFPFFQYPHNSKGFHYCFWCLVISASSVGALFLVGMNIGDFARSTVSYDLATPTHSLDDVLFPSLLVCNINLLRGSFVRGIMQELKNSSSSYYDVHNLLQRVFIEVWLTLIIINISSLYGKSILQGQDTALSKEDSDTIENILNSTYYQNLVDEFYNDRHSLFDMTISNTKMFSYSLALEDKAKDPTGRRRLLHVGNQVTKPLRPTPQQS